MEKLLLIALLFSLPANLFMVVANVNGTKKMGGSFIYKTTNIYFINIVGDLHFKTI